MPKINNINLSSDSLFFIAIVQQPAGLVFLLSCVLQILILYYQNEFIVPDEFLYHSLDGKYTIDRVGELVQYKNTTAFFRYASVPFVLGSRILAAAVCLNVGLLLINLQVSFRSLLSLVNNCSVIFILGNLLITIGVILAGAEELSDLVLTNNYSLHYLLNIIGWNTPPWMAHPLKTANLFQIIYIYLLAGCLSTLLSINRGRTLRLVLASYGTGLLIWLLFIMFLQINKI